MPKGLIRISILFLLMMMVTHLQSQDQKAKLQQDKSKVEEEIKLTNALLDQTRKNKQSSLNELVILKNQISKREELIANIRSEIYFINLKIKETNDSIEALTEDLENLRDEYASMIYYAYKNRNQYDRMMFIFAAEDFNQAYQRLKYFQQYNAYRKQQAVLIEQTQSDMGLQNERLLASRSNQEKLLRDEENEKKKLLGEQQQKDQTVTNLSKQEKKLKKQLKAKEKAAKDLQKAIQDIIAEEIRLANERAKTKGAKTLALTPEELELSNSFMNNKGKLPWPVERGIISGTFGEHPHPVLKKVTVKNNGIDILTEENTDARAVFSGTVTRVLSVPNNNNVIIVRHGEYLTVYSNLDKVYVSQGDEVDTKEAIGTVFNNPSEHKTELHFEVWKAKTLQNPALWLAK